MQPRRRIDWPEILGPGDPSPIWKSAPARSDVVSLVREFAPLFGARHPEDPSRSGTVELALEVVGLVRAGLFFYDDRLELMVGSWGTDLRRKVVDEHYAMFRVDEPGRRGLRAGDLRGRAVDRGRGLPDHRERGEPHAGGRPRLRQLRAVPSRLPVAARDDAARVSGPARREGRLAEART